MKKHFSVILLLLNILIFGQQSLEQKITEIISNKNATIGVSVSTLDGNYKLNINGDKKLPMLSVFKFHLALAVLDLVDQGKLDLDQKIMIKKSDLKKNTWSPIREKYPNGNIELSLAQMLYYIVAESDNNATDILLKLIGGPEVVQQFIDNKGIKDFTLKVDEAKMHKADRFMYWNTTSPSSANKSLELFYTGKILSNNSTNFLMDIMLKTKTGSNKIVALLPKEAKVAHKTGSSGKNKKGLTVAENDIAIIELPNGKAYLLSIFVSDSMESQEINTKIIAEISKAAWDYFNH